jgi:Zn-dependent peptidase ImmA (M78 family)
MAAIKEVNVFGMKIKIKEMKNLAVDGKRVAGCFEYGSNTIFLEKTLPSKEKRQTLVHELCHALFYRNSLYQTKISSDMEEIISDSVATMMTEVFDLRLRKKQ